MRFVIPNSPTTFKLGRLIIIWLSFLSIPDEVLAQRQDTTRVSQDTTGSKPYQPSRRPTYRPTDRYGDPFSNTTTESPLYL